ncbi:MAG: glycosyltransferase, partial [Hyphomicrobiaceae bacterium]
MKTILLATDAWAPQINGVVRTYQRLQQELPGLGAELHVVSPNDFRTMPMPTYPEIRLAFARARDIGARMKTVAADAIHIATEGPIGWAARRWCLNNGRPFTTCFHTRFPEYVSARLPVPVSTGYAVLRRFHNRSAGMMVATPSLADDLRARGFTKIR